MATAEATLPQGFRLTCKSGMVRITWRGPTHWVFVFVGVLGVAVSGGLLANVVLKSYGLNGASFVVGAGLLLSAYFMLVGLFNHTSIGLCEDCMQAKHGPLPSLLPRVFNVGCRKGTPIEDIRELRVVPEGEPDPMTGRLPTYAFHIAKRDGTVETLLTRMELEDARPLGKVLADTAGVQVVLPEPEQPKICVRRLRQP